MDVSCASATGIFDPFTMQWSDMAINILQLPRSIFPDVVDTVGDFGVTPAVLFGTEIPICCSVSYSHCVRERWNYAFRKGNIFLEDSFVSNDDNPIKSGSRPSGVLVRIRMLLSWRSQDHHGNWHLRER